MIKSVRFFDVIRVDDDGEESSYNDDEAEFTRSLKYQKKLSCYLKSLFQVQLKRLKKNMFTIIMWETDVTRSKNQFPLVKVEYGEDDEHDESGYDYDDSNTEYYAMKWTMKSRWLWEWGGVWVHWSQEW